MSEWISVKEKLPEFKEEVLLYSFKKIKLKKVKEISIGYLDNILIDEISEKNNWIDICNKGGGNVTHWMPLPEPPK